MRFRRLTLEELKPLEKEFVYFLASHSIPAEDWVKMKEEKSARVDELIEEFSDFILQGSLQKIEFVEQNQAGSVLFFHFGKKDLEIISGTGSKKKSETWEDYLKAHPENILISKIQHTQNREDVLFDVLNKGGFIIEEEYYNTIKQLSK